MRRMSSKRTYLTILTIYNFSINYIMWKYIAAFVVIYILLLFILPKRYYFFLPTIPIYPNNEEESKEVERLSKTQSYDDKQFFELTDPSIIHAFKNSVDETVDELDYIIKRPSLIIFTLYLKGLFNRARPYSINENIKPLESTTDNTPSYPAGHAIQAYCLANVLGKKYPEKKEMLGKIAEKCDKVRVKAEIHNPSVAETAKKIPVFL
jgi:hypothetical protein